MEVTLKFIQYHRFINRGFFIGPYCPIYGSGAVVITFVVGALSNADSSIGTIFFISFFLCGTLEYLASFYMEKKFHARWWDYSQKPMNLNGRVWIGNLILFGLGGTIIIKVADPVLFAGYNMISMNVKVIIACLIVVVMLVDYVMSHFVMKLIKVSVEHSEADNTEAISSEIRGLLTNRSIMYRRFADAYPNVIYRTEKITKKLESIKKETERLRGEAEQKLNLVNEKISTQKENFVANHMTAATLKNDIIAKQAQLIEMLEQADRDEATDIKIKELKEQISKKKETLEQKTFVF